MVAARTRELRERLERLGRGGVRVRLVVAAEALLDFDARPFGDDGAAVRAAGAVIGFVERREQRTRLAFGQRVVRADARVACGAREQRVPALVEGLAAPEVGQLLRQVCQHRGERALRQPREWCRNRLEGHGAGAEGFSLDADRTELTGGL